MIEHRPATADELLREAHARIAALEAENKRLIEALDDLHMHGFAVGANIMVPQVEWDAAFTRANLSARAALADKGERG